MVKAMLLNTLRFAEFSDNYGFKGWDFSESGGFVDRKLAAEIQLYHAVPSGNLT